MNHWGLTCQSRRHRAESLDPAQDLAPILVRPPVTMGRKPVFEDLTDRQISNAAETLEVMIRNLDPND
jgi:hypothetical protein